MGPEVTWYLGVAAFLFATGSLGVLLRRNPLIVLLSLEIMLNGGNLALIAFARNLGDGSGQIFALAVMAHAALPATSPRRRASSRSAARSRPSSGCSAGTLRSARWSPRRGPGSREVR